MPPNVRYLARAVCGGGGGGGGRRRWRRECKAMRGRRSRVCWPRTRNPGVLNRAGGWNGCGEAAGVATPPGEEDSRRIDGSREKDLSSKPLQIRGGIPITTPFQHSARTCPRPAQPHPAAPGALPSVHIHCALACRSTDLHPLPQKWSAKLGDNDDDNIAAGPRPPQPRS